MMDGMELPAPATVPAPPGNVGVSKLLDRAGRVGEPEVSGSDRADSPGFGGRGCSSRRQGCSAGFRSMKVEDESRMNESKAGFIRKENGDAHHLEEMHTHISLSPKYEGEALSRKSLKQLGVLPCSKRPRTDQMEKSVRNADADELHIPSKRIASEDPELAGFTCPENKKKRCRDGKRTDKKSTRTVLRAKYDSFTPKSGFTGSDSAVGGDNILGINGLKSNLCDLAKHVGEFSLTELLDGSYKCPSICPDKVKRAQHVNESILISVRKAYSVLPPHGSIENNESKGASLCSPDPNSFSKNMSGSDDKHKCIEKLVPSSKANLGDSILHQPKVILERLSVPPAQSLDELLNLSMPSLHLQSRTNMPTITTAGLPPFTWSYSHNGSWKPSVDSGKLSSTRITCQARWVRISGNSSSVMNDHRPEQELKILDKEYCAKQQKIDDILGDIKALTIPVEPSLAEPFNVPNALISVPEVHPPDDTFLGKDSRAFTSSVSKDSSGCFESERDRRCQGSVLMDPLRSSRSEVAGRDQPVGSIHGGPSSCSYPCEGATGGCSQNSLHASEISERGHSPAVIAAEILCEISSARSMGPRNESSGRIKWPKAPSQKTMKARKTLHPSEKADKPLFESDHYDPSKSKNLPCVKAAGEKKQHSTLTSSSSRSPASTENGSGHGRLESDSNAHSRLSHGKVRPSAQTTPSPTRIEKGYDGPQPFRRGTLNATSLGFGGTFIKDWSRGKSKRM